MHYRHNPYGCGDPQGAAGLITNVIGLTEAVLHRGAHFARHMVEATACRDGWHHDACGCGCGHHCCQCYPVQYISHHCGHWC